MSTRRGNVSRTRPQKYQNRSSFKNDLHDKTPKTKFLNALHISGVCSRCKDIIDWKIKYKKYKPLTAPTKCVRCELKTVKHAYHAMCLPCARKDKVCAKCCKKEEVVEPPSDECADNAELQQVLKTLPERKRRTVLRFIKKQSETNQQPVPIDGEYELPNENHLKDLISKLKMDNDDYDDLESSNCSDSEEDNEHDQKDKSTD